MDSRGRRSLSASSASNICLQTEAADAADGGGGITQLDYTRAHIVVAPGGQGQGHSRHIGGGAAAAVPVENMESDRNVLNGIRGQLVREATQQAAEVCRTARQICVQNGNAGAERATLDTLSIVNQIAVTFQK